MSKVRLAVIYGSVREGRFADTVVRWAVERIAASGKFEVEVIDPREQWPQVDAATFKARIAAADAVLVVTPEYNHSFPGPLKTLIDSAGAEWRGKAVGFVSHGGVSGGLRAVEHLRGVFAELRAHTIRETVSFANAWETFGEDGEPVEAARCSARMSTLLDELDWWARALRNARETDVQKEAA